MKSSFPPINPKFPHFLHGADYNPDQWQAMPDILKEDIRLMKKAECNVMALGIFAWSALEPEEGRFTFDWLDRCLDDMAKDGIYAVLATPSGARPAWLAQKYPEVLRMDKNRSRNLFGHRHNHCFTSPVYREKCRIINTLLAERYKNHPALLVWHLSNEYGGTCHCPLCEEAFRVWLRQRYGTLENLNAQWWSSFWSHTYSDWSQIESPSPKGENYVHALNLDWRRFTTAQTVDFMKAEAAPLKEISPGVPLTTNMMGTYYELDYWKFAPELDVMSWDSYPTWGGPGGDWKEAVGVAFTHDIYRSLKGGKPFMLMESTPSMVNWKDICKPKRPGMHRLASLQAVAHGADTIQYFQWRKSRGASEKFHGAVVDHCGHENTRVFRDVTEVGEILGKLDAVVGSTVRPEVAVIFDWENRWALDDALGPRKDKGYEPACLQHYQPLWKRGIPTDVIQSECDFTPYKLVIAPMLYLLKPGVAERLEAFVQAGGTLVTTYMSGIVNESDLCFLGGFPGPLRKMLGIWSEEIDSLFPGESNTVVSKAGNALGLSGTYQSRELCDLIHVETATVLATYGEDFYIDRPALTENRYGKGRAYYVASRNDETFMDDFTLALVKTVGIHPILPFGFPEGVTAQLRTDGEDEFIFLLNFRSTEQPIKLGSDSFEDLLEGGKVQGDIILAGFGTKVLKRKKSVSQA